MKKVTGVFAAVLLCLMMFRLDAAGATQAIEVQLEEDRSDCIFQIQWQGVASEASVRVTSPGGEIYGTEETPELATVMKGCIYLYIGDASEGSWMVSVAGTGLGSVDVTVGSLPQSMKIDSFTVTENGNGNYRAAWSVSDCPENATVRIYANTNSDNYDGTEVSGIGRGAAGSLEFSMPDLDSGFYYFYLVVTADSGAFNCRYVEEPYFYNNENRPEKLQSVKAGLLDGDVFLGWEGDADTYQALLFDVDTKEVLFSETTSDHSCLMTFPEGCSKVLAAVASCDNGRLGQYDLYEVSSENTVEAAVTFPEESATNQPVLYADVSFSGNCTVSAVLNGLLMLDAESVQGEYAVNLEEGENTIVFLVTDDRENTAAFVKEIYRDSVAPQLSVKRNLDGISTGDSYIYVEGYTEAGAVLTCNGQEVELTGSYFSYKQHLSYGTNQIQLVARDLAGNETRYTAEVKRPFWSVRYLKWIILAAASIFLLIIETKILRKGKRRFRR